MKTTKTKLGKHRSDGKSLSGGEMTAILDEFENEQPEIYYSNCCFFEVIAVFFLCLGYICCMLALIFWSIPVAVCLWILAAFMLVSCVVSASVVLIERCLVMALVNTNSNWERKRPNDRGRG